MFISACFASGDKKQFGGYGKQAIAAQKDMSRFENITRR